MESGTGGTPGLEAAACRQATDSHQCKLQGTCFRLCLTPSWWPEGGEGAPACMPLFPPLQCPPPTSAPQQRGHTTYVCVCVCQDACLRSAAVLP